MSPRRRDRQRAAENQSRKSRPGLVESWARRTHRRRGAGGEVRCALNAARHRFTSEHMKLPPLEKGGGRGGEFAVRCGREGSHRPPLIPPSKGGKADSPFEGAQQIRHEQLEASGPTFHRASTDPRTTLDGLRAGHPTRPRCGLDPSSQRAVNVATGLEPRSSLERFAVALLAGLGCHWLCQCAKALAALAKPVAPKRLRVLQPTDNRCS